MWLTSEITFLSNYNLWQCGVFFTNGSYGKLFIMFFITPICVYDFCETVYKLVKKNTPCQGMIWIVPSKMLYFFLAFWWYCTNSLVSLEKPKNKCKGRCPWAPAGALSYAPRTMQTRVVKKNPPHQLIFAVHTSPEVYFIDTILLTVTV